MALLRNSQRPVKNVSTSSTWIDNLDVQSASPEQKPPAPDLPMELLNEILRDFVPSYSTLSRDVDYYLSSFLKEVSAFAPLRLVNKSWFRYVTPILYSVILIPCYPEDNMHRRLNAVKYQPRLVKTLILMGSRNVNEDLRSKMPSYLSSCLAQCSKLTELCVVNGAYLFWNTSKGTIERIFRCLSSQHLNSVFFLTASSTESANTISTVLRGLGPSRVKDLTNMQILARYSVQTLTCPLPRDFPSIERLSLTCLTEEAAVSILSRIRRSVNPTDASITASIAPFHLSLDQLNLPWTASTLLPIITINNIALHITSLTVTRSKREDADPNSVPTMLLKTCPNLRRFLNFAPTSENLLHNLPPHIEEFGILIPRDFPYGDSGQYSKIETADQVVPIIKSHKYCKGVRIWYFSWDEWDWKYNHWKKDWPVLEAACREKGVGLRAGSPFH